MKLWDFLKERMLLYRDRTAFTQGNISYNRLINIVECMAILYPSVGKPVVTDKKSKILQAIDILSIIASKNVCVPLTRHYGQDAEETSGKKIDSDVKRYDQTAFIIFTSGSLGKPKGVMLSDENIIENIRAIDSYFDVEESDSILIARPLVHISVLTGEFLFSLYKGLEINFYEEDFNPQRFLAYLSLQKITVLCSTPTMIYHLASYKKDTNLSLKSCVVSGERLQNKVVESIRENFGGVKFYNVYGLTENSPRATALLPEDFFNKIGSIGKPILNTEVKILHGQLLIKSNSVMQGYYNNEKLTAEKIKGGYLYSGDIAKVDKEGFYYILGRKDNILIRSGLNINPEEIENILLNCDGVRNCLVYGQDNEKFGQMICCKILGEVTVSEVRNFANKNLPPRCNLNKIEIVKELSLTTSGKLKRK